MKFCDKCKGTLILERAVDLEAGLAITVYACLNCGWRKPAEPEPRPLTERANAIR
jgi:RNase P subunit RPR2